MATAITTGLYTVLGPYPGTVAADDLDVPSQAADVSGNTFTCSGDDLLIAVNSDVSPHTITFTSQNDPFNRLGTITDYSIGAGETIAFRFAITGWAGASNVITVTANDTTVLLSVLRL